MLVLLAFLAYVALEIWVLVLVGQAIGFLGLLGLLIVSAVVGAWALKREGRRSIVELGRAVQERRPAEAQVAAGMYVALAGVLLVVPGMLSTVAALVLLVPPVRRALARRAADRAVRAGSARMAPSVVVIGGSAPTDRRDAGPGAPMVIEGAPVDTDRDR